MNNREISTQKADYTHYSLLTINYSLICITGKMASGKNYICSQLEKEGWVSLDADVYVHKAIDLAQDKILDTFGPYAEKQNIKLKRDSDGKIDRQALGKLLFSFPSLLEIQESIVYAIITEQIKEYIEANRSKKIIINATLLYKTPELMNMCEHILYVKAPFFTRLKRAHARDNLSYREILKRFKKQTGLLHHYKKTGIKITLVNN